MTLQVLLHRGLKFRGEMADENEQRNWIVKDLGNVTASSTCTFNYGFRSKDEVDLTDVKEVPFQVQLLFTRPDGMKCVRVATTTISVTDDRSQAEGKANVSVLTTAAVQRAAKLAKGGAYEEAQMETRAVQRFMQRTGVEKETLVDFSEQVESIDGVLRAERSKEKATKSVSRSTRSDETAAAFSKATKLQWK